MTAAKVNADLAGSVGELRGLLIGIQTMISENNRSLNVRIDDMHNSNTRRLDDLTEGLNKRLDQQQTDLSDVKKTAEAANELAIKTSSRVDGISGRAGKISAGAGAGSGAIVAAGIEIIKAFLT